jgi:hypothetical protein
MTIFGALALAIGALVGLRFTVLAILPVSLARLALIVTEGVGQGDAASGHQFSPT